MSELKTRVRKAVKAIKDNKQVREGIGLVLNAMLAIALRAIARK